ncbi:MAG: ribosome-associated translation inhibitor RaiA [Puniceicoccales bacterium]|jgi:putative sigma-54 modulation protein|nr:ribosome-associated translation inhibitor RaiA [Puniceicoccales bacterium]
MNKDVIISGVHLELTEALKQIVREKAEKLFRHEGRIIRVRFELIHVTTKDPEMEFIAKGHIEIQGPDIVASATSNDLYKSIDLLIQKLDRQISDHFRN